MLRILTAAVLAPLAFLAMLTGVVLVAWCERPDLAWDRVRCELPDTTIFVTSRKWSDESPTLAGDD